MNPPKDHTRTVVVCITLLGMSSAVGGMWLLWKGFTGGGELVVTLNTAIAGLVGFLGRSNRAAPADQISTEPQPEKKE